MLLQVDAIEPGRVMLRDVSIDAEGTYKCEVSSEGPTFNTDFAVANLSVFGKYLVDYAVKP